MKNSIRNTIFALGVMWGGSAMAAPLADPFVLPTPENNTNASYGQYPDASGTLRDAILMNGIPVAFKYDDFWSYSAHILESIQTVTPLLIPEVNYGTYDFSVGTGTIDVNLTSTALGATNDVTLSDGTVLEFQDPDEIFSNQTIEGWTCDWGGATQACDFYNEKDGSLSAKSYDVDSADVGGTTTVGEILTYMQDIDPTWTVPLIYADYNQTGGEDSLWLSAVVELVDPTDATNVVASWYLDASTNGMADPSAPTYNFGEISFMGSDADCAAKGLWNPVTGVGCAGVTDDGSEYSGSHNKGSGQADFMAFAPTMDLSAYDSDLLWKFTVNVGCIPGVQEVLGDGVGCNTNGGEEFGIIGGVGPVQQVPSPGTLALLGAGIVGFGFTRRLRDSRHRS